MSFDRDIEHTYHFPAMSARLPEFIEPVRLAELGRTLRGRMPLGRFGRLAASLNRTDGEVEVAMEFGMDEQGRARVIGKVSACLEVLCQRCLSPMSLPMDLELRHYFITSDAEESQVPEGFDALLVGEKPMFLADIVEDELILGLPLVAKHPEGACLACTDYSVNAPETPGKSENPFAVLAGLKTDKRR